MTWQPERKSWGLQATNEAYILAIEQEAKLSGNSLSEGVAKAIAKLTVPVDGRTKAMLAHHGITDDVLDAEVEGLMLAYDHADCVVGGWNGSEMQSGCKYAGRPPQEVPVS